MTGMQAVRARATAANAASAVAAVALGAVIVWDLAGAAGALPERWPVASHALLAAAIAAATAAVLIRVLRTRSGSASHPLITLTELAATGALLGAWLLRGHPEIPPDPPLIAVQVVAAFVWAGVAWRRRVLRPRNGAA
jgi:hypothetical protein